MIDREEHDRISRVAHQKADVLHRVKNLETEMGEVQSVKIWFFRAIGAGIIYMIVEVGKWIASSGGFPR